MPLLNAWVKYHQTGTEAQCAAEFIDHRCIVGIFGLYPRPAALLCMLAVVGDGVDINIEERHVRKEIHQRGAVELVFYPGEQPTGDVAFVRDLAAAFSHRAISFASRGQGK